MLTRREKVIARGNFKSFSFLASMDRYQLIMKETDGFFYIYSIKDRTTSFITIIHYKKGLPSMC